MDVPRATYRLQFNPGHFRFREAHPIVEYLDALGVSHVYASPIFKARSGSEHGYDVVDLAAINPELGSEEELYGLLQELERREMGWLQDFVPNHMAFHKDNALLMDVLENGDASRFRNFFDVDWDHPYETMNRRLLAPFLGTFFGDALEKGEISLRFNECALFVHYYDLVFPLSLDSSLDFYSYGLEELKADLGEDDPTLIRFQGALFVLRTLPTLDEPEDRANQVKFVKGVIRDLYRDEKEIRNLIDRNLAVFNGKPGRPESFNLLETLLSKQHYRLAYWKVAAEEVNYRRFFNINELICLRQEDPRVFTETHALVARLLDEGHFSGLRVDHIDGLYDPAAYLKSLRKLVGERYLVVEKILAANESLPVHFPVQGTTGYDFLDRVNELLSSGRTRKRLTSAYRRFAGLHEDYREMVVTKKRLIIGKEMAGEIDNLARLMKKLTSEDRMAGDITMYGLKRALVEVLAQFPVYRAYADRLEITDVDRRWMYMALERSRESAPGLAGELALIQRFLLLEFEDYVPMARRMEWLHFVRKFQQVSGPLMAKGFEDTTLYTYNRFLAVNEVGGDLDRIGMPPGEFHRFIRQRLKYWPHSMNATATHDTKRGEDVRARLNVLSELAREWEPAVRAWRRRNRSFKKMVAGRPAPDANDEYFLYQTLLGAWPLEQVDLNEFRKRIADYLIKAVREAKVHTAWIKPDVAYENAFVSFFESIVPEDGGGAFLEQFLPFQRRAAWFGLINSLAQTLVKLTAPGVPDFYQGTELWDFNLVDPDNRRPVDYRKRFEFLKELEKEKRPDPAGLIARLLAEPRDGRLKLFLILKTLALRKEHPDLFTHGDYRPFKMIGSRRGHFLAYARRWKGQWLVAGIPLQSVALTPEGAWPLGESVWGDTEVVLPKEAPGEFRDVFSGRRYTVDKKIPVSRLIEVFPVMLICSEGQS